MPLAPGLRLGPYEVSALIGTGGMGEVYRAMDTNLKRQVALKVLPASLAGDVERLARFQREAEVLAALNHPHIAQIYGLEKSAGVTALVMELVEGEDLSHRIARGAIPVDEALPIARQIADALETAHEQGIVHRDLKPANIKVREDGTVKVLDFGLAKALALDAASATAGDVTNSPTITSPAMTAMGMILGTAAYMSPEQARGRPVDKRADIWAFGCVLYEMLTGQRAFKGEDVTETLAHVLTKEPDWHALPAGTPPSVDRLIGRCLQRDPRRRLRDIGDVTWDLDDVPAAVRVAPPPAGRRLAAIVGFAAVTGAVAAGFATAILLRPTPPTAAVGRFLITTPPNAPVVTEANLPTVAISPDGSRIMYRTSHGEQASAQTSAWYVRDRQQLVATSIRSSEGFGVNGGAFFSPDGEWIVFAAGLGGTLKRASVSGGPAETICPIDGGFAGGSWGDDGQIVFATTTSKGLRRVRATGGEPEVLTTVDPASGDLDHRWPEVLPGGRGVVFTAWRGSAEASRIMARAPDGRISTLLSGGSHPRVTSTGLMVFAVDRTLRAVRFDATTLSVVQNPVTVIEGVGMTVAGAAHYAISAEGSLVYVSVGPDRPRTLVWVDRQGREEPTAVPARVYVGLRVSPDGTRVALDTRGQNDIYVWDFRRDTLERFTNDQSVNRLPTWNPDGSRLAFTAETDGTMHIYWQAADLSGTPERLSRGSTPHAPQSFSPDGKSLLFITQATPPYDVGVMHLGGEPREEMLLTSPFNESFAEVSPDGHWLAYQSDQSGRNEVHVRPFPNVRAGSTITVSTSGGTRPLWSRDGDELFYYVEPGTVMAVPVRSGQSLSVGKPAVVVKGRFSVSSISRRNYDVAPDGKRFLMMKDVETTDGRDPRSPEIVLVQNWTDELQRLVPVN